MSNPQNLEPRVERLEVDMVDVKQTVAETARNVSELRSAISTLYDLVAIQQQEAQVDREQARADRALMLNLIQAIAQGRNGG